MRLIGMHIRRLFVVALFVLILTGLNGVVEKEEVLSIKLVLEENVLLMDGEPLLEGVIDYALTSLDNQSKHLLVLHEERSQYVDEESYLHGIEDGHRFGGYLRFYELVDETTSTTSKNGQCGVQLIYESDFTSVNPWCIDAGHMDDNGDVDIFVGAYRATRVYDYDRRPFLFEWSKSKLKRVWTGSYLNMRTFYEAGFEDYDEDGFAELYAIQPDDEHGFSKYFYKKGPFTYYLIGEKPLQQ